MGDIKCPYCKHEQDVCSEEDYYEQDQQHQMECEHCEKCFTFTTEVLFCYSPSKADCLNDGEHDWKPTNPYDERFIRMRCKDCDERRMPTADEMQDIMVGDKL